MSARNTESLHGFYRNARREMLRLDPRTVGVRRIGHFGFFRRKHGERLWPHAGEWLQRQAAQA
jgi:predicted alpha/beta hydrolase